MMMADIDVWALPLNTFLLLGLAIVNAYIARQQRKERRDITDVKQGLGLTRREYDKPPGTIGNIDRKDTGERRRMTDTPIERRVNG